MKLKKLACAVLACAAAVAMLAVPASAATVNATQKIELLSGAPIDKDGVQYESIGDTITPGQTVYFLLPGDAGKILGNSTNIRVNARRSTNAKYIGNISVVSKRLTSGSGYFTVPSGFGKNDGYSETNSVARNARNTYIAVELKDYTGEDELKIELDVSFTVRKSAANGYGFSYGTGTSSRKTGVSGAASKANPVFLSGDDFKTNGDKMTLRIQLYMGNNQVRNTDITILAGSAGQNIEPVAAEENTVTFEDRNDTLATLTYLASSNPDKFYAKLSTKWTSALLAKFENAEAFIYRFQDATIDSSSRAKLSINNPFDTEEVNPKKVYIYRVSTSGVLSNVTSSFTYDADEDAYTTKTRTIGTYVLSDTKIKL